MIRVLIVEDDPIVREGLQSLLRTQPDMEVVGEAACAGSPASS
ncbi:MAG: response regulator transcription factor [Myxococcales bacterium]|nr:response regulator transcription factor [Myxococcales bacterium]